MSHRHRAWADIHCDRLRHNVAVVRRRLRRSTRLLAVLKADAYGLGAPAIARELAACGVDAFGVGDSSEALELRDGGIPGMVLVLGAIIPDEIERLVARDVSVSLHAESRLESLVQEARRQGRRCRVHLKIDTGMGRLGVMPSRALALAREIARRPELEFEGVATHLAGATAQLDAEDERQLEQFREVRDAIRREGLGDPLFHAASSAAVFSGLYAGFDMVRCGLALYGTAPAGSGATGLRPAVSLHTQVIYLKDVPAGTTLGYRRTHRVQRPTRIATLPMGYNDGLLLGLSNRGRALVRGRSAPIVGQISMDYSMLDVGQIRGVEVGDRVTLVGRQGSARIGLDELARSGGTIPYEILCSMSRRVARVYHATSDGRAAALTTSR